MDCTTFKTKRKAIPFLTAVFSLVFSLQSMAAAPISDTTEDRHANIIRQALYDQFCETNIELLQKSASFAKETDKKEPRIHFADPDPSKSLSHIDRQCKLALNFAGDADTNVSSRARVLYYFGNMMHTLQDFYCQSNFVELKAEAAQAQGYNLDPYTLELPKWQRLNEIGVQTGNHELDKCCPDCAEGSKKIGNVTYRKIADALAIRETERQWDLFQHLVKRKYGLRSTAIIVALKHASCPAVDLSKLREELP